MLGMPDVGCLAVFRMRNAGRESVLGQFGITGKRADSALRVSISSETTEAELDEFCAALREGMEKVRG